MNTMNTATHQNEEISIDFRKIINKLLERWLWFVISIVICLISAWLYIRFTAPIYQVNAKVLVNDNDKPGASKAGALMDLGSLLGSKNSVDNEAEILKTRFLMEQVVRELKLNIIYSKKNRWFAREVYQAPFILNIISGIDTLKTVELEVEKLAGMKFRVKDQDQNMVVSNNQVFKVRGLGTIAISSINPSLRTTNDIYKVKIMSIDSRVASLMRQLSVTVVNKQVSIINLGLSYPVALKGEEILNAVIRQYINSNLQDKNIIADSTSKFIKNRLSIIAGELGDVEVQQKQFKQSNKLADISEQSKLLVKNTADINNELSKAETQVIILSDLEAYLKDESRNKRIFPTSLLPQDLAFSGLLNQYNVLLVDRDRRLMSMTEENPVIKNIDDQIAGLRSGILSNIQSTKNTFVITRNNLRSQLNKIEGRVSEVPQMEKDYLKLARNQQIKQELYIFLMQKAEETAISKTANISIAKIIDPPKTQPFPISPKTIVIFLAALIIGGSLPIVIIYLVEMLNTSIGTKEDIKNNTSIPIVGEISHNDSDDNLIIANQSRSAISEQFRALRTNLSFYLKNADEKVILLTSSMSGEGKSFTSINLGNILALAGKKVLLMELDLRKPGLSAKLGVDNTLGFTNYIINKNLKAEDIVKPLTINPNMSIVTSGPLPPNPAETLLSEHTATLIEELKKQFDYIIMDAPPIGIIADAQLLAPYADVTLYLVRQKVTQKNQLTIVNELYHSAKMKNIGIVINDIKGKYNEYGYGYGYGSYDHQQKKSWFSKVLKK